MKIPAAVLVVLTLALTLTFSASRAEAQVPTPYGSVLNYGGASWFESYYIPSYSYWTAAYYGYPPRVYVGGYGANDFPYYGRPYGSPSDPWSWPAMAGYAYAIPTRYNLVLP